MDSNSYGPVLTLEQAAQYLQVDPSELIIELESQRIPALKIAGEWRLSLVALNVLLVGSHLGTDGPRNVATTSQIPQSAIPTNSTPVVNNHQDAVPAQVVKVPTVVDMLSEETKLEPIGAHSATDHTTSDGYQSNSVEQEETSNRQQSIDPRHLSSRTRGRVFGYNSAQGYGYARLANGKVVWLDSKQLRSQLTPFPNDLVEFELVRTKRGLEARDIRIILMDGEQTSSQPDKPTPKPTASEPNDDTLPSQPPKPTAVRTAKTYQPPNGTPKSQELYQRAALARAEGRYSDARRLFRQAIEAGAGTEVYTAFFKMETERGSKADAKRIIEQAIDRFPSHATFHLMHGQLERRSRNFQSAEGIFRAGLKISPRDVGLRWGLGQTLVQIGSEESLREAGRIFAELNAEGKLNSQDGLYQRFKALQRNERASRAYDFFHTAGLRVGITGRRDLPEHITDIVAESNSQELNDAFGIIGAILVRCFQRNVKPVEIINLSKFLRSTASQHNVIGLQDGREVVLNPSIAFIAVPNTEPVHDQVMSILSDSSEAIVPLDDSTISQAGEPLIKLRDLLGQYLGMRDLYSSTLPVSGRRFFGREHLLLKLTDEVHRGQFLGIYGLRKMGKTSLIYQLRDEKLSGEAVAYVDLQASAALMAKNCDPLYWELERDLYQRLRDRHKEAASLLRLGKIERFTDLSLDGGQISIMFAEDIRALLDAMSNGSIPDLRRLVIVLDELERMLPLAGQEGISGYLEFFGLLRGLAQTERYRGLLSSVVVAANASISERSYWEGRENPVFALYKPIFLPPLSRPECEDMIRTLGKGMSVYWEDTAIGAVFSESDGHPFLTRILCSRIAREHPNRPLTVTEEMVINQLPSFIRDESDKLEQIIELLRTNFPDEEKLLEQIALGIGLSPNVSDDSLRHLLGYHLVAQNGTGYHVTLNLLCRWLRRRAGIKE